MRIKQFIALIAAVVLVCAPAAFYGAYQGAIQFYQSAAKADVPTGNGSPFTASTTYNACTDVGGGLCINGTGAFQLANSIAASVVFGANTAFTVSATAPTIAASTTTNPLAFTNANTGTNGAYSFSCAGCTGSIGNEQGVVQINANTSTDVYDLAMLGSQTLDSGKAEHTLVYHSAANTQDGFMLLCSPQANCNGASQKIFTLNVNAGAGSTPSLFIVKGNGDVTGFGNITANSTANGSGEILSGNASNITLAPGVGDIIAGGGTTSSQTNGTCASSNPCGGHFHQSIFFSDASQNAAAQTCTAPMVCQYTPVTTQPTSFQLTFLQSFTNKPLCTLSDITHPGSPTISSIAYNGSPITSVTFTVGGTSTVGDTVIVGCWIGNGP